MNRDAIQAEIDSLVARLEAHEDKMDEENGGPTPEDEAEIFSIEQRIKKLRAQLG